MVKKNYRLRATNTSINIMQCRIIITVDGIIIIDNNNYKSYRKTGLYITCNVLMYIVDKFIQNVVLIDEQIRKLIIEYSKNDKYIYKSSIHFVSSYKIIVFQEVKLL